MTSNHLVDIGVRSTITDARMRSVAPAFSRFAGLTAPRVTACNSGMTPVAAAFGRQNVAGSPSEQFQGLLDDEVCQHEEADADGPVQAPPPLRGGLSWGEDGPQCEQANK